MIPGVGNGPGDTLKENHKGLFRGHSLIPAKHQQALIESISGHSALMPCFKQKLQPAKASFRAVSSD